MSKTDSKTIPAGEFMEQSIRASASDISSSILQDIFAQPSVIEQLKSIGRTGEALELPVVKCEHCRGAISEQMVRGLVRRVKPWLLAVRGRAFCSKCRVASPVEMRLHSCGTAEILRNGEWVTRRPSKVPDITAGLAHKSRTFAELVATAFDKTREGVSYLYEHRNDPVSELLPRPAFFARIARR